VPYARARSLASPSRGRGVVRREETRRDRDRDLSSPSVLLLSAIPNASLARTLLV
jgi:hypothetical protein